MPYDENGRYISDMEFYILAQQEAERRQLEQRAKAQAEAQKQQLGQTVGTVGGVTAGNMISSALTPAAAPVAAASAGVPAAPVILGASRVPAATNAFGIANTSYIPGATGTVGMVDILANKKHGGSGALQGGLSGAGIGYTIGGPVGAAIGAPIGAGIGYFGNFGDENRFQTEAKRAQALKEKGVNWNFNSEMPTKGRSKEELTNQSLPQDFMGFDDTGKWTNNRFANDRNEGSLRGEDTAGYAAWGEKMGNDYMEKLNHDQRIAINNKALELGAIREHHGTIDIAENSDLDKYIEEVKSGKVQVSKAAQPTPGQPTNLSQNIMSAPVEPEINKKMLALDFIDKIGSSAPNMPKPTVGIPQPASGKTFDEILQSALGG